jgi:hypothetical protein
MIVPKSAVQPIDFYRKGFHTHANHLNSAGHTVSVFFSAMTQCLPVNFYWDHFKTDQIVNGKVVNPNYSCFNRAAFSLTTAGLAILTDVLILTIPIAMTWPLRLNIRRKLAVILVLSLGWVVVAMGVVRFKIFYDFWTQASDDPTYGLSQAVSGIEVNLAILASCGPALKAIMTRFAPRFFGSIGGSRPSGNVTYSAQRFELQGRAAHKGDIHDGHCPSTSSRRTPRGDHRDIDADSQEEIITHDSLGARKPEIGMAV